METLSPGCPKYSKIYAQKREIYKTGNMFRLHFFCYPKLSLEYYFANRIENELNL